MPIIDTFPRNGRWDSVGLSCSSCIFFVQPLAWPDKEKKIFCKYHHSSLSALLNKEGFMRCESFCRHFEDNKDGRNHRDALAHFLKQKSEFDPSILYCLIEPGKPLEEIRLKK